MAVLEHTERVERALGVVADVAGEVVAGAGRHDREPATRVGRDARDRGNEAVTAARNEIVALGGSLPREQRGILGGGGDLHLGAEGGGAFLDLGEKLAGSPPPRHRVDDHRPSHWRQS